MHRLLTFRRLSILFLALFALCMAGVGGYTWLVTVPGERCEKNGGWWDPGHRVCAMPISIAELTGRPLPGQRAAASEAANRDLLRIERGLAEQKRARDADRDRQAAVLAAKEGR